jgi:hypothetical protein
MPKKKDDLIADLQEMFDNLRKFRMMLNPKKCVFGVPAGKFLDFIISHQGIEVNREKSGRFLRLPAHMPKGHLMANRLRCRR